MQVGDTPPQVSSLARRAPGEALASALAALPGSLRVDSGSLSFGWRTLEALSNDPRWIDRQLADQASSTRGLDPRGQAAAFITGYSLRFALIAAALFVSAKLVPELDAPSVALRSSWRPILHGWRPRLSRHFNFRLLSEHTATSDQLHSTALHAALRTEIEQHFTPLIEALHHRSRLSRPAMWRLVGDSVAVAFLETGRHLGQEEAAKADAMSILKIPGSPLNNRQLHFFDIVLRDPSEPERILARRTYRARGGCCRYYTARPGQLCSTCVLKDPTERDRALATGLRRRLGLPQTEE